MTDLWISNDDRDVNPWDDVSARASLFSATFPHLSQDPNVLWALSTSPISPQTAALQAYAMAGAQATDNTLTQIRGYSESQQRNWWANISDADKAKYSALGYEPPAKRNDAWGAGTIRRIAPGFDKLWQAGFTGAKAVGGPVLRGMNEIGEIPFEMYQEVRTGSPEQQLLSAAVAVGAIVALTKGGGRMGGLLGNTAGAGGITYAKALSDVGGAGLSLSFMTGASAAWATKAITDTVMGNTETWGEPLQWVQGREHSERNFTYGSVDKAAEMLEGDTGLLLNFAKAIALEEDDPIREVLTEFAGATYPPDQSKANRQQVRLATLERMLLNAQLVPGTEKYIQAYQAGVALLSDDRFSEAVDELVQGKISVGRDAARILGLDWTEGVGKLVSGSVDAASWILVDPIIGAAKFGHAQRIMRRALMVDSSDLMTRIGVLVDKPGTRAAFRVMANGLNAAETDNRALARLARQMPDVMELVPAMRTWQGEIASGTGARATQALGTFWDEERVASFFKDSAGLAQLVAGKGNSYRFGFVYMPYLNPIIGERASLMKQNIWSAIDNLDDIHLGIADKTFAAPLYEQATKMGVLPNDPERIWESSEAVVRRNPLAGAPPVLQKLVGLPAALTKTLLTRTPSNGFITLAENAGEATRFVAETRSLTELMRMVGVPSHVRQQWMDLILRADNVGGRRQAILYMYDTVFRSVGMRSTPEASAFVDKFLNHVDEVYSLGLKRATMVGETSTLMAVPNLTELRKAVLTDHLYRNVLGVSDASSIDAFMNKVWKPAVLLRIGFATRAIGDELLGWVAREGIAGWTQARMAKHLADDRALPGHVRWIESTANLLLQGGEMAGNKVLRRIRGGDDFDLLGQEALELGLLRRYGQWFRRFTEQGTWLGRVNWQSNFAGRSLEKWASRPGSFRSMLLHGVDDDLVAAARDWMANPRVRSAVMREVTATKMVGTTKAMQGPDRWNSSQTDLALAEDPGFHMVAAGRSKARRVAVADPENLNYGTWVLRGQRQMLDTDWPIRERFLDIELSAPDEVIRRNLGRVLGIDPYDVDNVTGEFARQVDRLRVTMLGLTKEEKVLLHALLVESEGSKKALDAFADAHKGMHLELEARMLGGALDGGTATRGELLDMLIQQEILPQELGVLRYAFDVADRHEGVYLRHWLAGLNYRADSGRISFRRMSAAEREDALRQAWVEAYTSNPEWRRQVHNLGIFNLTSETRRPLAYQPKPGEAIAYMPYVPHWQAGSVKGRTGTPVPIGGQLYVPVLSHVGFDPIEARNAVKALGPNPVVGEVVVPAGMLTGRNEATWLAPNTMDPDQLIGKPTWRVTEESSMVVHVPDRANGSMLVQGTDGEWRIQNGASMQEALEEHARQTVKAYQEQFYTSTPGRRDREGFVEPELKEGPSDPSMQPVIPFEQADELPLRPWVDPISGRYDLSVNVDGVRADMDNGFPFLRGETRVNVGEPDVYRYPDQAGFGGVNFRWSAEPGEPIPAAMKGIVPDSAADNLSEYVYTITTQAQNNPVMRAEADRLLSKTRKWSDAEWDQMSPNARLILEEHLAGDADMFDWGRGNPMLSLSELVGIEAARRAKGSGGASLKKWADEQLAAADHVYARFDTQATDDVARIVDDIRRNMGTQRRGNVTVRASDFHDNYEATYRDLQMMLVHEDAASISIVADDVAKTRALLRRLQDGDRPPVMKQLTMVDSLGSRSSVIAPAKHRLAYADRVTPAYPEHSIMVRAMTQEDIDRTGALAFASTTMNFPYLALTDRIGTLYLSEVRAAEQAGVNIDTWFAQKGMYWHFVGNFGAPPSLWFSEINKVEDAWQQLYLHELGHQFLGHTQHMSYNSGMERATNAYSANRLGLPLSSNTWRVPGEHAHPESALLGSWFNNLLSPDDQTDLIRWFNEDPDRYTQFLNEFSVRLASDPQDAITNEPFRFSDMLAKQGWTSARTFGDEGETRLMWESVGPFAGEYLDPSMRHASLGAGPVVLNAMPRDILPGSAIERSPVVYEAQPRGWDKMVHFGFGKVIGPLIDSILREPMALHHYARARRDAMAAQRWLLDPRYFARAERVAESSTAAWAAVLDHSSMTDEEIRLSDLLSTDLAKAHPGKAFRPDPERIIPTMGDPVVSKAMDISLGRAWFMNDITPEPWLVRNRDKVLDALGNDPEMEPLRTLVGKIIPNRTDYTLELPGREVGELWSMAENRVVGLDVRGAKKDWEKMRGAARRMGGPTEFEADWLRGLVADKERTLAIIEAELDVVDKTRELARMRPSKVGSMVLETTVTDQEGLELLYRYVDRASFGNDPEQIGWNMLDWWGDNRSNILNARSIQSMTRAELTEASKHATRISPFGPLSQSNLLVLEGAHKNREAVTRHIGDIAETRAILDTIPYIDRDNIRSQFSDSVRNLIPFWAAEDQFMRRWARIAQHTPEFARKAQLLYMGMKQAGVVQTDEFGNDYYVYPGSTAFVQAVAKVPFLNVATPMAVGLTGQVRYSLPGLDRFGVPQVSPLVAIPMNAIGNVVPEVKPFARTLSGDRAVNLSLIEQLVPTQAARFMTAFWGDPEHSARMMGSMAQAIAVLEANGQALPDNATPEQITEYKERLANHTRTIYIAKALFGFFAPASPSDQILGDPDATVTDPEGNRIQAYGAPDSAMSFRALTGLHAPDVMLNDEYVTLVRNLGVEDGTNEFLRLFPDSTPDDLFNRNIAYRASRSETLGKAPIGANDETWTFYVENEGWIKDNPMAGAWLMPPASRQKVSNSESQRVRMEQMAAGLRSRVGMEDYIRNVRFAVASKTYFDTKRKYKDRYAVLTDQDAVRYLKAREQVWTDAYLEANPIFAQELQSSEGRVRRQEVLAAMRNAMGDPETPTARHSQDLFRLLRGYDSYRAAMVQLDQRQTEKAKKMKEALKTAFRDWGDRLSMANPDVAPFWQGIVEPEADLD